MIWHLSIDQFENEGRRVIYGTPENATAFRKLLDRQLSINSVPRKFSERRKEPKDEVQIYTWKDATLWELTDLVLVVVLPARKINAMLSFAFVYPDKNGRFVVKQARLYITIRCQDEKTVKPTILLDSSVISLSNDGEAQATTTNVYLSGTAILLPTILLHRHGVPGLAAPVNTRKEPRLAAPPRRNF